MRLTLEAGAVGKVIAARGEASKRRFLPLLEHPSTEVRYHMATFCFRLDEGRCRPVIEALAAGNSRVSSKASIDVLLLGMYGRLLREGPPPRQNE